MSLRFSGEHLDLIDQHRTTRGWSRQEWFDRLVVRGLQGAGLLSAEATAPPEGLPRVGPSPASTTLVRGEVEPILKAPATSRVRR